MHDVHIAMASRDEVDKLLFESVVRDYHVCKTVWTTFVGEILTVGLETADRHAACERSGNGTASPNRRPCASHFLPIVVALLDAQRTGNVCIKRCRGSNIIPCFK